ncbi:MAG: chemotaxis protein CheD [Chitinispirillaceae bacterium]
MRKVVGVADMCVSGNPGDLIVTHALGSCIGVAIYDKVTGVGGILHYMLPFSKADPQKASTKPLMFGDTGIPALFQKAYALGAKKENLRVVIAGGAEVIPVGNYFDIGNRNILIARKIFWKNRIMISSEQVGGRVSRTLYVELATGSIWMVSGGVRTDL